MGPDGTSRSDRQSDERATTGDGVTGVRPAMLDERAAYRLMTGIVVPRPIAWISTLHADGQVNLAPFSCYTFISSNPVMVGISIGRKGSDAKDTLTNIRRTGSFTVNVPHVNHAELVHRSAEEFPRDVSEVDILHLTTSPGETVDVPRLTDAPIAMECVLAEVREYGDSHTAFVVGRVEYVHLRPGLLVDGKIDTAALAPLGRVAGPAYAGIGPIIELAPITHTMYQSTPAEPA